MIRFLKVSLITLTVTVLLIASLIVCLIQFSHPNTYKPLITQWVKEKTQRELKFDGDIKLTFSPRLSVKVNLEQVFLSEYKSNAAFATAKHIYLSLSLQSLLEKQLAINGITIQGLTGQLIRATDGRMNIDDLIATDDKEMQFKFHIDQIRIEDALLLFDDAMKERHYALSDLNLTTGKITNESLDNLKLTAKGGTEDFAKNDAYDFEIKLDVPNLRFDTDQIESSKVSMITKVTNQKDWLKGKITLSNISSTGDQFRGDMLLVELATEKEAQITRLHLSSSVAGNLKTQKLNLPNIKTMLSLSTPDFPDQPISGILQGNLAIARLSENIRANLTGNIKDSHIRAKFNMMGFENPALNVVIDIDQLNMDQLLPRSHKKTLKKNQIKNKQQLNAYLNKHVDSPMLAELNANGSVRIGVLRSGDITLSDIQFKILSNNNSLIADPMQ